MLLTGLRRVCVLSARVLWMCLIILHWAWLLTGWPCAPLRPDSLLYGPQQKPRIDPPPPPPPLSYQHHPAVSSSADLCGLDSLASTRIYPGSESSQRHIAHIIVQINAVHPPSVFLSISVCSFLCVCVCVGLWGLQTYILHPSLEDDLMGRAAAITILAGVNRNSM